MWGACAGGLRPNKREIMALGEKVSRRAGGRTLWGTISGWQIPQAQDHELAGQGVAPCQWSHHVGRLLPAAARSKRVITG